MKAEMMVEWMAVSTAAMKVASMDEIRVEMRVEMMVY